MLCHMHHSAAPAERPLLSGPFIPIRNHGRTVLTQKVGVFLFTTLRATEIIGHCASAVQTAIQIKRKKVSDVNGDSLGQWFCKIILRN